MTSLLHRVYQADEHINNGEDSAWHYVWITNPSGDERNFVWNNLAGHSWSLVADKDTLGNVVALRTGEDCPYYLEPFEHEEVKIEIEEGTAFSIGTLEGPFGDIYYGHDFWT